MTTRSLLLVTALLCAASLGAQPARTGPQRPDAPREEIFRMIDAYVVSNMQESLGLSDEQFVKLLPLVKASRPIAAVWRSGGSER